MSAPRPAAARPGRCALALPLAAGLALPFVTSGRTAIPPFAGVGFAAVPSAAPRFSAAPRRRVWDFPVPPCSVSAAGHLLFAPGLPFGHDCAGARLGTWAFSQEFRAGDLFPRWLHQFGVGLPLLQFYGPLNFYRMLPFAALGLPAYAALKGALLAAGVLGAVAMYADRRDVDRRSPRGSGRGRRLRLRALPAPRHQLPLGARRERGFRVPAALLRHRRRCGRRAAATAAWRAPPSPSPCCCWRIRRAP